MSETRVFLEPREAAKVEIDYNQAVYQAYLNCINSFRDLENESQSSVTGTVSFSHVARDRFESNVSLLEALVLDRWKDEHYKMDRSRAATRMEAFHVITELLHRRGFFEQRVSLLE